MVHERAEAEVRVEERREYVRYEEDNRVLFLQAGESGKPHEGRLRDLSAGGLCLLTGRELAVGARLYLGIFFQHRPNDPLLVLAEVRRCTLGEEGFSLGLKFVKGTHEQREALLSIQTYLIDRHG